MEREVTLEDLSKRYPEVEKELPEGSMVEEKPPKPPSPFKKFMVGAGTNVIIPVVLSIALLFAAPYILDSAPSWLVYPSEATSQPE